MENKKFNQLRRELIRVIKKWKICQPVLADHMNMPIGTFKNKLHETGGKYTFSDSEFLELASVADRLMADFKNVFDQLDAKTDYLI